MSRRYRPRGRKDAVVVVVVVVLPSSVDEVSRARRAVPVAVAAAAAALAAVGEAGQRGDAAGLVARERLLVEGGLRVGGLLVGDVTGCERLVDRLDGQRLAGRTEPGVELGRGDLEVARDGAGLADLVGGREVVLDLRLEVVALVGRDVLVLDGRVDAVLCGLDDGCLQVGPRHLQLRCCLGHEGTG